MLKTAFLTNVNFFLPTEFFACNKLRHREQTKLIGQVNTYRSNIFSYTPILNSPSKEPYDRHLITALTKE